MSICPEKPEAEGTVGEMTNGDLRRLLAEALYPMMFRRRRLYRATLNAVDFPNLPRWALTKHDLFNGLPLPAEDRGYARIS